MLTGRQLSDSRFQLDALDGLRGLAVLIVFVSHAGFAGLYIVPGVNFIGCGRSGVYLFFVLSAFLLSQPFVRDGGRASTGRFLANYALRRFLRIFPLYSLYLLAGFVSTLLLWRLTGSAEPWGLPLTLSFDDFLAQLLLQRGEGVTWSIVVEFHYYLLLPLVALAHSRIFRNRVLPCTLFTVVLILVSRALWPPYDAVLDGIRLGPYLPTFFLGALLAVLHERWRQSAWSSSRSVQGLLDASAVVALAGFAFMMPVVARFWYPGHLTLDVFHNAYLAYGIIWSVLLFASVNGRMFRAVFEWQPLRYLGFISFSVYLIHIVVIRVLGDRLHLHPLLEGWLLLALTTGVSHLTWLWIEKPTSRLKLREPSAPRPQPQQATP